MAKLIDVGSIACYFETLVDPRHYRNRKHRLVDIAVIAVAGILCGCDGPTAMHRWAMLHKEWLGQYLALPNGIPSRDCIRRLLMALKPKAFQRCFQDWLAAAIPAPEGVAKRLVAIDGKTCRGSHDAAKHLGALHIVSAWASEEGIALGQVATDAKSNEITAIPLLLQQISLANTIVTIDAMGCQQDIVKPIVAAGGDFVIAVKDNQPKLKAAIESFFHEQIERDFEDLQYRSHETCDTDHGRLRRLRRALCLHLREELSPEPSAMPRVRLPSAAAEVWQRARDPDGRVRVRGRDPRFWPAAAVALDVLQATLGRVSEAAHVLGIATANLVELLQGDPHLWQEANALRQRFQQKPLR